MSNYHCEKIAKLGFGALFRRHEGVGSFKATTTTTATRTLQICIFDNETQQFCTPCTCSFHFRRCSRSFYDVKWPVLQLWAYDVKCSTLSANLWGAGSNLIPGKLEHVLQAQCLSTRERTSSENVTSRFCNNFSIIPSNYACKLCSKYPGIKLESAPQRYEDKMKICRQVLTFSTELKKTGDFTS